VKLLYIYIYIYIYIIGYFSSIHVNAKEKSQQHTLDTRVGYSRAMMARTGTVTP
jgi:hypothetical protein